MFGLSGRSTTVWLVVLAAVCAGLARLGVALGWAGLGAVAMVVGLVGFVGFWVRGYLLRERRSRELDEFATHVGWEYTARSFEVGEGLRSYPFGRGIDREDVDVIRGAFEGRRCAAFTHRYTDKSGDSTATYEFQVVSVELGADYPTLNILPEDVAAKAAKLVGGMDVDFESAEFNRRWRIEGEDPRYVHDMITPRVMQRLVQDDARGRVLRVEGHYLLTWTTGRLPASTLSSVLGLLTSVAAVLPPHVERELRDERDAELADRAAREAAAPDWARTPGALTSRHWTSLGQQEWAEENPAEAIGLVVPGVQAEPLAGPAVPPGDRVAVPPGDQATVVAAAIVDDLVSPQRLLAASRSTPERLRGRWEFPGGKVDGDETPVQALHRELEEELGVRVRLGRELVGPEDGAWRITPRHLMRLWLAVVVSGEPTPLAEHEEIRWLGPGEWLSVAWLDGDVRIVEALLDGSALSE
jgi:8-oxo-dGTP diphosphatase